MQDQEEDLNASTLSLRPKSGIKYFIEHFIDVIHYDCFSNSANKCQIMFQESRPVSPGPPG